MKVLSTLCLSAILSVTSNVGFVQAQPPSYPLLCRGGASMRIMTNHDVDAAGVPGATSMFIYFKASNKAGSVRPPRPGECVWLDRTFRSGEPEVIFIKSSKVQFAFQVMGNGRVVTDTTGYRLNVEGANISSEAQDWQHLVNGVMQGRLFTVDVYNAEGRVMMITRVQR